MTLQVHRVEVRPHPDAGDPQGRTVMATAKAADLGDALNRVDTASVYLLEGDLTDADVKQLAEELLGDPVADVVTIGASSPTAQSLIEVHPQVGVMDPGANAVGSGNYCIA